MAFHLPADGQPRLSLNRGIHHCCVHITGPRNTIYSSPNTPANEMIVIKGVYSFLETDYYFWVNPEDNLTNIGNIFYGIRLAVPYNRQFSIDYKEPFFKFDNNVLPWDLSIREVSSPKIVRLLPLTKGAQCGLVSGSGVEILDIK